MDSPVAAVMPTTPIDNSEPPGSETQPNKRRRKKSIVWEYFTVETVGDGCTRACCKQCKKSFAYITGSKLAGTSHLKRHITMGICPVSRQKNQQSPYTPNSIPGNATDPPKRRYRSHSGFASIPFNQDRCSHEIAKMIIMHDYPPHIVEHSGFVDFVHTLQPQFNVVSFNTIQGDCVAMYLKEKQSLLNFISNIPGRVNLTLDLWNSNQTVGYAVFTGYFIDGDWNLHRRILNVVMVPSPDSDFAFNQALVTCLSDWHLKSKLLTLTVDHSFSNETINQYLRGFLPVKNPLMLNGQLLIGNCYARVISRLAQDAIGATGAAVKKIRDSVKYVKTSDAHEEKFLELKEQLRVPSKIELFIDDQTKWNTTFHMLGAANELKQVFSCLETYDPDYKIVPPSMDEWKQVEILCIYLKSFFDAANILTSPTYPTASAFYHEVSKIQLELTQAAMSEDPFVSYLTRPLKEKFNEYWRECFLVLAVAVIMDPRFKMKLIEFSFSRIYGEDADTWIKVVDDGIHELFDEYLLLALPPPDAFMEEGNEVLPKNETLQEQIPQEDTTIEEIPQEGTYQDGHPQEGNYQENPQEGHYEGGNPQEGHYQGGNPQEATYQGGNPQEGTYQGGNPQEGIYQGGNTQEGIYQEGNTQDRIYQERNTQEGIYQEGNTQEGIYQEGNTQDRIYQEGNTREGIYQEGNTQEGIYQEGNAQERTYQEGTHQGHPEEPSHGSQEMPLITIGDGLSDFEVYICELASTQPSKSELDQYLEESLLPRAQEFDILEWWKLNQHRYPTLSKMASDILSIPFSTVAPDSVFDTTSKKMDAYRTLLRPVTLEALICAKDWFQYGSLSSEFTNSVVKMEF